MSTRAPSGNEWNGDDATRNAPNRCGTLQGRSEHDSALAVDGLADAWEVGFTLKEVVRADHTVRVLGKVLAERSRITTGGQHVVPRYFADKLQKYREALRARDRNLPRLAQLDVKFDPSPAPWRFRLARKGESVLRYTRFAEDSPTPP